MEHLINEAIFWSVWLIIPLIIDIFTCLRAWITVFWERRHREEENKLDYFPEVTIIVPVFNSEQTLKMCVKSIEEQNYPIDKIEVFIINNGSQDQSFDLYCELQENSKLKMWWLDASKGKANALNKGLYLSNGKYIVNIDSDGILEPNAIGNMVQKFEMYTDIDALTGVILINEEDIEKSEHLWTRILQRCEMFEYSEAFLVGRGYESHQGAMFTLAGAYSAFRKQAVFKTQLYNVETLGEDTHMTAQIRELAKGKVALCENAYFLVDPIESIDKLYIQRQRWQRGEIEVGALFEDSSKKFKSVLNRTLIKDHTLVFPRMIWMFAMCYLIFINYPMKLIIGANIILYLSYMICSVLFFATALKYLEDMPNCRKYMRKHWYTVVLLPVYRMMLFFIRMAGIINAVEKQSTWNTKTFSAEKEMIQTYVVEKFQWYFKVKEWINNGQK